VASRPPSNGRGRDHRQLASDPAVEGSVTPLPPIGIGGRSVAPGAVVNPFTVGEPVPVMGGVPGVSADTRVRATGL
jgi:hypothetical protein